MWLVSGVRKSYLACILAEPDEGCQTPRERCCNSFVTKNLPNYHLSCRFKIFIGVLAIRLQSKTKAVTCCQFISRLPYQPVQEEICVICRLGGPYSEKLWPGVWKCCPRPRSQFFAIRTDPKPANNLFIFFPVTNWLTSGFTQLCHWIGRAYVPSTNHRKN